MSQVIAYSGALLAAWASMGGFCLRSDSIRSRQRMPRFSAEDKQRYAYGASFLCLLSLTLLWLTAQPSFALILWVVLHGACGMLVALLLPYAGRTLPTTFSMAGVSALVCLSLLFVIGV
jgi:hypothetical protein